jgi:hypothetical protein
MEDPEYGLAQRRSAPPARETQGDRKAAGKFDPARQSGFRREHPSYQGERDNRQHGAIDRGERCRCRNFRPCLRKPIPRKARDDPASDKGDEHEKCREAESIA